MILKIRKYGEAVLKKRAEEVKEITPEIKELIFNMKETLRQAQGVGLAAPQIGESKRIIIVEKEVFLNPKIIKKSEETEIKEEGCLCIPRLFLKIKRAKEIEIEALNEMGQGIKAKASGLLARIFQHEIDHLNGILILDKIPFWQKWKIKKILKNI